MTLRTLLIGAPSPLGRAIRTDLAATGHTVHPTSRTGVGDTSQLDLADLAQVAKSIRGIRPRAVIYLARPEVPDTDSVNEAIDNLRQFAEICVEEGVRRVLFASSGAVYGTASAARHQEDDPVKADGLYAELKLRSEITLASVADSSGISALSFRIFNIYGPGFNNSLVNRLVLGNHPLPVLRKVDNFVRDYVHSSDVARAFTAALDIERIESPLLNLGTGVGTSNNDLIAQISHAQFIAGDGDAQLSHNVADISLIRKQLSFNPAMTIAKAVRKPNSYLR